MTQVIPAQFWPPKTKGQSKAQRRAIARQNQAAARGKPPARSAARRIAGRMPPAQSMNLELLPAAARAASARHNLRPDAVSLACSMACPAEVASQRLPSDSEVPTCMLDVHSFDTVSTGTDPLLSPGYSMSYVIFKQPARATLTTSRGAFGGYGAKFDTKMTTNPNGELGDDRNYKIYPVSTTHQISAGFTTQTYFVDEFMDPIRFDYSSGQKLHGDHLFIGLTADKVTTFLINPGNVYVSCELPFVSSIVDGIAATLTLDIYEHVGIGEPLRLMATKHSTTNVPGTNISATINIGTPMYGAIKIRSVTANTGSTTGELKELSFRMDLNHDFTVPGVFGWSQLPIPEISEDPRTVERCKVVASSLLITNQTADLTKQGNITAATVGISDDPIKLTHSDLGTMRGATSHKLANGCYTWQRPERAQLTMQRMAFDLSPTSSTGGLRVPYFNIDEMLRPDVIHIVDSDSSTPTTLRIRRDMHVEFRTSSQRYTAMLPSVHESDYSDLCRVLSAIPNHTDNPIHWHKLAGAIKGAYSWMQRNKGMVFDAAHLISDLALPKPYAKAVDAGLDITQGALDRLARL